MFIDKIHTLTKLEPGPNGHTTFAGYAPGYWCLTCGGGPWESVMQASRVSCPGPKEKP